MSNPPSNSVVSVHTEDAAPDAPKFRLSAVAGHDTANVVISAVTGADAADRQIDPGGILLGDATPGMYPYIASIRLTLGPRTATPIASLGCVCGLDRCGAPGAMPLHVETDKTYNFVVREQQIAGGPDGDVTVNVYTLTEPEGWV